MRSNTRHRLLVASIITVFAMSAAASVKASANTLSSYDRSNPTADAGKGDIPIIVGPPIIVKDPPKHPKK